MGFASHDCPVSAARVESQNGPLACGSVSSSIKLGECDISLLYTSSVFRFILFQLIDILFYSNVCLKFSFFLFKNEENHTFLNTFMECFESE